MIHVRLRTRHAVWLLPVIVFVGCSRISPPQPATDLNCSIYDGGHPLQSNMLEKGDAGWNEVAKVLASKQGKWDANFIDYAPRILIRADDVSWNFQTYLVIANFKDDKGNLHQVTAPLENDEFGRILKAVSDAHDVKGQSRTQ